MRGCRAVLVGLLVALATGTWLCWRGASKATPAAPAVCVPLANRTVEVVGFQTVSSTNQTPSVRNTLPYVLVTKEPVDKTLRLAAEAAGARVIGPYPPQAFLVEADAPALRRLAADSRFVAATEFLPSDKIDEQLAAALRGGATSVETTVVALAPVDKAALRALVASQGGEELKGCLCGLDSFRARLPAALVEALSKRGEVRWLELFRRPKLLNDMAVEPAAMNVRPVWNTHGLTGAGQVVSTSDSGIDTGDVATMHRDLRNSIAGIGVVDNCHATDTVGHGTHTAVSIVGDGTMSDGAIRGTAYGAKLWAWFCMGTDGDLYFPACDDMFRPDQEQWPTFIHSASWGARSKGAYDTDCQLFDTYVWEHADFLPVVACGNSGSGAGTVESPAAAKNVLAVGATQNARTGKFGIHASGDPTATASYSSRGPCKDGRVKPDVSAPGSGVLSTRAYGRSYGYGVGTNTNYAYNCGTSMATPLTAGAVALVREWLVDRCGFTNEPPSAALMKAIVVGGAKGAAVPNNNQGWGRIDLEETLFPSNCAVKLIDRIPFASGKTFKYVVETTNAAPLDVQLVWIDRSGTTGGSQTSARLVNDLDLKVTAEENGTESAWYGNGGSGADHTNTVESVRLAHAPTARYLVTVVCNRMTYDYLDGGAAALYLRGAFDPETVGEPEKVTVTVAVEAGPASADVRPAAGTLQVNKGETVTFAAPEWAYQFSEYGTAFAHHAYLGYSGTGDAPETGTARSFSVVVSNDTSVTWRYGEEPTDFLFTYYALLSGVTDEEYDPIVYWAWMPVDTTFSLRLPEDAAVGDPCVYEGSYVAPGARRVKYGRHVFRLGMVSYAQTDALDEQYLVNEANGELWPSVEITMDEGVDLLCYYFNETERTTDGLPYWWYIRYLWGGASYLQYDGSATGDPDGDGFSNAAEYADGTDPVDDRSFRFEINAFTPTNVVYVGSVKGKMIVERSGRLGGEWKGVQTNAAPRTSVTNATSLTPVGNGGFYRVRHEP